MIESLTKDQIDLVLRSQIIGRIGCSSNEKTYIVPVAYAYDGKYIYAHSKEGQKILMMRKNSSVCFQVDSIDNMTNWRSVVVWGQYEELKTSAHQLKAFKLLKDRFEPFNTSETAKPTHGDGDFPAKVEKQKRAIFYRIAIREISGRYEKN